MKDYFPSVIDAEYLSDYRVLVTFDNGERRVADFAKWLDGRGVYKRWRTKSISLNFLLKALHSRGKTVLILRLKPYTKKVNYVIEKR